MKLKSFSRKVAGRRLPILLAAGLALSACSLTGPGGTAAAPQSVAPTASRDSAATQSPAGGATAAPSPSAPAGSNGLPVLDYRDGLDGSTPVRVELNDIRVRGQIMWVTLTARNTTAAGGDSWQVADFLSTGSGLTADGINLVDSVRAKRYLPGHNADDGRCLCTDNLGATFLDPGQGVVISVAFAAPPPEVTELDVLVPNMQPFVGARLNR